VGSIVALGVIAAAFLIPRGRPEHGGPAGR
jgi:hypothetical protein